MKTCIEMETEVIGIPLTYKPWWNKIQPGEKVERATGVFGTYTEKVDRNNNKMATGTVVIDGSEIRFVAFSSAYSKYKPLIDATGEVWISGKKNDKGDFIVNFVDPVGAAVRKPKAPPSYASSKKRVIPVDLLNNLPKPSASFLNNTAV